MKRHFRNEDYIRRSTKANKHKICLRKTEGEKDKDFNNQKERKKEIKRIKKNMTKKR